MRYPWRTLIDGLRLAESLWMQVGGRPVSQSECTENSGANTEMFFEWVRCVRVGRGRHLDLFQDTFSYETF